MLSRPLICLIFTLSSFFSLEGKHYIFFLHSRFIELEGLHGVHPDYGAYEYQKMLDYYRQQGFEVISEVRARDTDANTYAKKVVRQIKSLLKKGTKAEEITVIGASKGGYIAQYVSSLLKNKQVSYVFIGACYPDETDYRDISYYGRILSIYEQNDSLGQSCLSIKNRSKNVTAYTELALNTGTKHGFLYKAFSAWMKPSVEWALHKAVTSDTLQERLGNCIRQYDADLVPVNGIVLVSSKGVLQYAKVYGYSDISKHTDISLSDQFCIASVSKQFTAVLTLQAYQRGQLKLQDHVSKYLPELHQPWADSVTIHHLLTHTHGIPEDFGQHLLFKPGTQFRYSQAGMALLEKILEKVAGTPFTALADSLFTTCGMTNTCAWGSSKVQRLAKGYSGNNMNTLVENTEPLKNIPASTGGFISTAADMLRWNEYLHGGKLLHDSCYQMMVNAQPNAIRQHPLFGETHYGYGITVSDHPVRQLGQTGYVNDGFPCMNFYFPGTGTSLIILSNTAINTNGTHSAFATQLCFLQTLQSILSNNH